MTTHPAIMIEGIRKLIASQYEPHTGFRCINITIPDGENYVSALAGMLRTLQLSWAYVGEKDDRLRVAKAWEEANSMNCWDECFDCPDVAECIETSEEVHEALANAITNVTVIRNAINSVSGGTNPYGGQQVGSPIPESEYTRNQAEGTNPTCNLDILWAQCLSIVELFNRNISDVLEDVEVASNVVEILSVLEELPLVKYAANFIGGSAAIDAINYFQESVNEQYLAEYDLEYENDLACALFCAARGDCELSIDLLFTVLSDRVVSVITDPNAIGTLVDLLEIVSGLEFDSTIVVDLCMWFCAATWKLGNFIFGRAADYSFSVLLQLAVDDASPDWQLLCECADCQFIVEANIDPSVAPFGQDSGIAVVSGSTYRIKAIGTWNYGTATVDASGVVGETNPAAVAPDEYIGSLIVKIGESDDWSAGSPDFTFGASITGNLYFAMNDVSGAYGDNSGTLCIIVEEI